MIIVVIRLFITDRARENSVVFRGQTVHTLTLRRWRAVTSFHLLVSVKFILHGLWLCVHEYNRGTFHLKPYTQCLCYKCTRWWIFLWTQRSVSRLTAECSFRRWRTLCMNSGLSKASQVTRNTQRSRRFQETPSMPWAALSWCLVHSVGSQNLKSCCLSSNLLHHNKHRAPDISLRLTHCRKSHHEGVIT